MEQQKKKDNGGYLFANGTKTSDKSPDWRGKVNVGGKEYLISGWKRTQDGSEMISLSLTDPATLPPKQGNAQGAAGGTSAKTNAPSTKYTPPVQKPAASTNDYLDLDELEDLFKDDK